MMWGGKSSVGVTLFKDEIVHLWYNIKIPRIMIKAEMI